MTIVVMKDGHFWLTQCVIHPLSWVARYAPPSNAIALAIEKVADELPFPADLTPY